MSLFKELSELSRQHAENSGIYTFEKPAEPEPAPSLSLYNLLDHSTKDLLVAMVAMKNEAERIYDQRESSQNMADAYTSLCAWTKIFDTAIREKKDRDSEQWAEKTAKEINETL